MRLLILVGLLLLEACGPQPEEVSSARTDLPEVGRAVRLTSKAGPYYGEQAFDVVELDDERVRLRLPLCGVEDPGVWVEWESVVTWEDIGPAVGDDSGLGLPPGEPGLGYEGDE